MARRVSIILAGLALAGTAQAAPLQLVYDGYLSPGDTLGGVRLGAFTPFEARAAFDSSIPLAQLEPGASTYAPSTFTLTISGSLFNVTRVQDDPVYGQTVVIFDKTAPDSNSSAYQGKPHYGIGFFSQGGGNVGIIGDWTAATPEFILGTLVPTTLRQFYGVGYNDGPVQLTANGVATTLQLNDPPDYNATDPSQTYYGSNVGAPTIADNHASIQAVPEPGSAVLLASATCVLGLWRRRASKPQPNTFAVIAHPGVGTATPFGSAASAARKSSRTERQFALAVLTTERNAA